MKRGARAPQVMCGITGFFGSLDGADRNLERMAEAIAHRGPDDRGFFTEHRTGSSAAGRNGIALAHLRLAIIDLSPEGHQPMRSASGRFTIVFNGEIFNYLEIRDELAVHGYTFRGGSDTEVMLAAIEHLGVEDAVARFVGMFAFALWDSRDQSLWLARDRLGIKPLYYGWSDGTFLFGSELKALLEHPASRRELDPEAAHLALAYGYVPAPFSIYRGISKLPPAHLLHLTGEALTSPPPGFTPDPCQMRTSGPGALRRYWDLAEHTTDSRGLESYGIDVGDDQSMIAKLDELLRESVRIRMIADVPLGAFLSGGIDSSVVVALMQCQRSSPVKTYTIAFSDPQYNEAAHARAVAKHLGTEHTELLVDEQMLLDTVPEIAWLYDEPFGDSSQIPTLVVSRLARRAVTVALSGDGGDEMFCGYNRYVWPERLWQASNRAPRPLRSLAAQVIGSMPASVVRAALRPVSGSVNRPEERLEKLCTVLGSRSFAELYLTLLRPWPGAWAALSGRATGDGVDPVAAAVARFLSSGSPRGAMLADQHLYLPDDNLTKVDRASMRVALEVRVPLLDHRVAEFAARLPDTALLRGRETKWILRQVLARYVPRELVERPKMGFSVPIGAWLRGPLKKWGDHLLSPDQLRSTDLLGSPGAVTAVTRLWSEHQRGVRNHQHALWNVLAFQAWRERWLTR